MERIKRQVEKYAEVNGLQVAFYDYEHRDGRKGFSAVLGHSNLNQAVFHATPKQFDFSG